MQNISPVVTSITAQRDAALEKYRATVEDCDARLEKIREKIRTGDATLGTPIEDFVFWSHNKLAPEVVAGYMAIEKQFAEKRGEPILVIIRSIRQVMTLAQGGYPQERQVVGAHWHFGELELSSLLFDRDALKIGIPVSRSIWLQFAPTYGEFEDVPPNILASRIAKGPVWFDQAGSSVVLEGGYHRPRVEIAVGRDAILRQDVGWGNPASFRRAVKSAMSALS